MSKLDVYNLKAEKTDTIELDKDLASLKTSDSVLRDAIILANSNSRIATSETKTRKDVRGGGRKPWRQKGTGRARQGSIRAPQWKGGGVVFGPHNNRNYIKKQNRKERKIALRTAFLDKVDDMMVLEDFNLESAKTRDFVKLLKDLKLDGVKLLIITDILSDENILATRNLAKINLLETSEVNVLDLVNADKVLITRKALSDLEEVLHG